MNKNVRKRIAGFCVLLSLTAGCAGSAFAQTADNVEVQSELQENATQENTVRNVAQENAAESGVYTSAQFYADLNAALGYTYDVSEEDTALTRQEAASILYDALNYSDVAESNPEDDFLDIREIREAEYLAAPYTDVAADSVYFKEIAALRYYDALDVTEGAFRPEDLITADEAQTILENALTCTITVQDGADEIIRDRMIVPVKLGVQKETGAWKTQTLEEGTALLVEGDMLVPMNIGALIGGSVSNIEDGRFTIIMGGTPDGAELKLNEAAFDVDEDGRVSLKAVTEAFGGTFAIEGDTAILQFPRHILKSNRDLTVEEATFSYTKLYLEYWHTPLPERADEVAWAKEQSKYDAENPSKESGGTLYPTTYHRMVEEGYDPYAEEGWSVSADGKWASICVVSPVKGELEDAEAFSWWFAWHGLRDVRYMTWYPPAHWGLGIQNGNDAGRDGNNPNKQFRSFNTALSIHQRSYGLGHSVAEDTTRTSYNGSTDWIDFYLTKAKPDYDVNTGLNFKDLTNMNDTSPMGSADGLTYTTHFSVSADNTDQYLTYLLEEPQQIGTVGFSGQYMCHFLRWNKETKQAEIVTHFSSYNPQGWQNGGASMPGLAMHATREFARLADILVELYELEGKTPLEDDYDERSYVFVEIPDETIQEFYAAVNALAGKEVLAGGDESSLTRAEAAKALYEVMSANAADDSDIIRAFPKLADAATIESAWNALPAYQRYSDVDETTDGYQAIITLHYYKALDVVSGTFRPEDPLSATEAAKLLANLQIARTVIPVGTATAVVDQQMIDLASDTIVVKESWEVENSSSSSGAASANEAADDTEEAEETADATDGESAGGASDGESAGEAEETADAADGESAEGASDSGESAVEETGDSSSGTSDTYLVDDVYVDPSLAEALGGRVTVEGTSAQITLGEATHTLELKDGRVSLRALADAFAAEAGMTVTFRAGTEEDGTVYIYEAVLTADRSTLR